jgi:hypothetical protein
MASNTFSVQPIFGDKAFSESHMGFRNIQPKEEQRNSPAVPADSHGSANETACGRDEDLSGVAILGYN